MNEPSKKAKLRQAQQRHQSQLFGAQAQKPSSQAAGAQAQQRGQDLSQAAQSKQQRLSDEEQRKLDELKHRNARARAQQAPPAPAPQDVPEPRQAPTPDAPDQASQSPAAPADRPGPAAPHPLKQVAERSDMAAEALANMQRHARQQAQRPAPRQTPPESQQPPQAPATGQAPVPPPQPAEQPRPATPPPAPRQTPPAAAPPQPSAQPSAQPPRQPAPAGQRPAGSRRPPSPEELDRLLRQMADRARQRRAPGAAGTTPPPAPARRPGMPGRPEMGMDAAPQVESAPPPPDLIEKEKRSAEQSAEILKELQAREATAQRDIAPIPQSDQQRAKEEAVEARVPIKTEANAIDSGPLHEAIAQLQIAMRAQDPRGQVGGVNQVQRTMPHHPLYDPDAANGQHRKRIDEGSPGGAP